MSDPAEQSRVDLGATLIAVDTSAVAAPPEPVDPLVGTVIDGRYAIERVLGEGGMGLVYRARHVVLNKLLAIKVLRSEVSNNPQVIARFRQEAQSASAIGNQHIIDVVDFGTLVDGSTYFVMEYLDGSDLTKVIEREAPLPLPRVVHIARQLCDALGAAHGAGIIHRDLKPDNIALVKRGQDADFVKVLDFGIAKVGGTSSKLTQAGQVFGTPHYMPPEQCQGFAVDLRADIYALGIILFELVTGRVPFDSPTLVGVLTAHITEQAAAPSSLRPDCPSGLDAVILRCLEKNPDNRYANCADLLADIDAVAKGNEIVQPARVSGVVEAAPRSQPAPAIAPSGGSRSVLMMGIGFGMLGLAAMGFGAYTIAGRRSEAGTPPPSTPVAQPTPPVAAPAMAQANEAPAAGAPLSATIRILSEPAGAEVLSDDLLLGTTPLDFPRPSAGVRHALVLRHTGYEDHAVTISASTLASELHFELRPQGRSRVGHAGAGVGSSPTSAPAPQGSAPAADSTHAEPRPRRHTSEVINPWAN